MNKKHIFIILSLTFATFVFVSVRLDIVQTSYKINKSEKEEKILRDEIGKLTAKINSFQSPQRLEALSKKFKLEPSNPSQIVHMKD